MRSFTIRPLAENMAQKLRDKMDSKTKPVGSLGRIEELAVQVGQMQQSLAPVLRQPTIVVFAADHGIAEQGIVNPFPQEVTHQMVGNFLRGGAAINILAEQHNLSLRVVDAGVKRPIAPHPLLWDAKVAEGTQNYLYGRAMELPQVEQCIDQGAAITSRLQATGCTVVGFGEMGIGNSSAAALLMCALTGLPIEACVGAGTGLDAQGREQKVAILRQAQQKHLHAHSPMEILAAFGGFEIAMLVGAIAQAAAANMVIIIDGFIVSAALLVATALYPNILPYCIFSHCSEELGHAKLLAYFNADPLLRLHMRLGEGTGAAMAYPLVQSAVLLLNNMASFDQAQVSNRADAGD